MSVKGRISLATALKFKNDFRMTIFQLVEKYGDKFALKGLVNNIHFITDPKLIEQILYTNSTNYPRPPNPLFDQLDNPTGVLSKNEILERWKHLRSSALNPRMTEEAVKQYADTVAGNAAKHVVLWESKYGGKEKPFQIYPYIQKLALKNLLQGVLSNVQLDEENVIQTVDEIAELELKWELSILKLPWKFPTKTRMRAKNAMEELRKINNAIAEHMISDKVQDDNIFREVFKSYASEYKYDKVKDDLWILLRNIAGIFTIAGFDSLSHAMPIAFSYMSHYPEEVLKIRQEIKDVVGDGEISHKNVDSLVYTRSVFMETLRHSGGIFPLLVRQAVEDEKINQYTIKKSDKIIIPIHYMAHVPRYWENPEGFDPKRFLTINTLDDRYRYVHLTFGGGITGCAGRAFATLQCTIILATVLRHYDLNLVPNKRVNYDNPADITFTLRKRKQ